VIHCISAVVCDCRFEKEAEATEQATGDTWQMEREKEREREREREREGEGEREREREHSGGQEVFIHGLHWRRGRPERTFATTGWS
jgi:Ni/Co efflux regulator RcnB